MTSSLLLSDFLAHPGVILDVRSPAEYSQGHIPGAISLPLFTNEERATVGTVYKTIGKNQAIELGFQLTGPKLVDFIKLAREYTKGQTAKVLCWRGGMRSSSMAWLLNTAGIKSVTLNSGYKVFRRWVLEGLSLPRQLKVIGGFSGSGKTSILQELRKKGQQVLDLEAIAHHRGSSFGMIGMPQQPSNEQFENQIAVQWASFNENQPVWVEDESRLIGKCYIPNPIFFQMKAAPLFLIERPLEERLQILYDHYGQSDPKELIQASQRLTKQLGAVRTKQIIEYISTGHIHEAIKAMLEYYDATYIYSLKKRTRPTISIEKNGLSTIGWTELLTELSNAS